MNIEVLSSSEFFGLSYFQLAGSTCLLLHISCNTGTHDLPDMYTQSLWATGPKAKDIIINIRQVPCAYVTIIT